MSDKLKQYAMKEFVSRLANRGFKIKHCYCGAVTIFNGRTIELSDWFSGFWKDGKSTKELYKDVEKAVDKLIKKAEELCPEKTIAVGVCNVDRTHHFDYEDDYFAISICLGGY